MTDDSLDARHLLFDSTGPDAVLRARALSVYALYELHNGIRHCKYLHEEFTGAFRGYYREGCLRGFAHLARLLFLHVYS